MLDWLKPILGDAYTEEIDSKISAEIGRGFVSRADFNTVSTAKKNLEDDIKARDKQLDDLSKSQGSTEDLQKQIADLQKQNKEAKDKYDADLLSIRIDSAAEMALIKARAKNITAAKALLAKFLADAKLADDGTVKGLDAEINTLVTNESTSFLFNSAEETQTITGMQPGTPGGNHPPAAGKAPKDMTYDELCAYLESNPQAKL